MSKENNMHSIVYRAIVLWIYIIAESALLSASESDSGEVSASESGSGEVDNSAICVDVGAKVKKREPQSKYTDEDCYRIAKYVKEHGPNQVARYF